MILTSSCPKEVSEIESLVGMGKSDFMRDWKTILSEQLSPEAGRLTVEVATILYEKADINDLMFASLEEGKNKCLVML